MNCEVSFSIAIQLPNEGSFTLIWSRTNEVSKVLKLDGKV